ncbi:MAG: DUF29 domain-containing protein [Acetobacteraceae bacterium]|nr:DUF29 domain-containing protein [Acetobacteraceae bacterium]MBV8522545.1 DUF29 domain-containing protein [Acetobacteraceae bacterium]
MSDLYERDVYRWAQEQAAALRKAANTGSNLPIDWENVAEEIESVGRSEKHELENRLLVLINHLLKWQFQPDRRGKSWRLTIREQRRRIDRHLRSNPTLAANLDAIIAEVYGDAREEASDQTDLPENTFPASCPYTAAEILDLDWFPSE